MTRWSTWTLARRLGARARVAVARRFGVDARALAAFRISLGLLLLADLLLRARDVGAFYTDAGVLPRASLFATAPDYYELSPHALAGSARAQIALFALAAVFAATLLVGHRTTLSTAISLGLLASLQARNPFVLNGGDALLAWLLVWALFLPLGERWSVDARRRGSGRPRRRVANAASAALLLQAVLVYASNAALKLRGGDWLRGDAILYVFSLDQFVVGFGNELARHPELLTLLGRGWLAMLVCSPLLVLLVGRPRALFALGFVGTHLGMLLTMRLGLFPLVSIAALLAFLPEEVWDAVESAATTALQRVRESSGPLDRFGGLSPVTTSSRTLTAAARSWNRIASPLAAVFLTLVLVWNAAALGYVDPSAGPSTVANVAPDESQWNMFANPPRTDGWYVVPGRLESGTRIDALRGSSVTFDRPPDVARTYPNARWRKYLVTVRRSDDERLRRHLAAHLCHRWNSRHDDELVALTLYYVEQPTRLDGPDPIRPVELGRYSCSSGYSPDPR
ncbi:HTTM domain-containing protein [Halegenticoccus tardaugens]|uniref:HTTM domain-containing protein n=1 Tax=Halegenticoccus tardaugens TaxID=2071624 RepID=UPI00100AB82D|nr:HTTM domain-containing protein [Halegenticoccus tardaugens]